MVQTSLNLAILRCFVHFIRGRPAHNLLIHFIITSLSTLLSEHADMDETVAIPQIFQDKINGRQRIGNCPDFTLLILNLLH